MLKGITKQDEYGNAYADMVRVYLLCFVRLAPPPSESDKHGSYLFLRGTQK